MATKTQLGIKVRNELTDHIRASDDHLLDPGDAGFVHDRRDALSRDFTALLCQPSVNDSKLMATEKIREARAWVNFFISLLTFLILPTGVLVLRNQRLEIMSDIRKEYVSVETFRADHAVLAAENAQLKSDLTSVNAKLDRIQITLVRLTDSVKLKEEQ